VTYTDDSGVDMRGLSAVVTENTEQLRRCAPLPDEVARLAAELERVEMLNTETRVLMGEREERFEEFLTRIRGVFALMTAEVDALLAEW
jgi:hypothetical protein